MKQYDITITENAIHNMMNTYIEHKKIMMDLENDFDEYELYEDGNYNYHRGCYETAESYMRLLEICPTCNYIMDKLYESK